MEKKFTKKEILAAIKTVVADMSEVDGVPTITVIEFIDTTIDQINAKAEKAKAKAAEKKTAGDELREEVFALVTDEWQTADDITKALGKESVTKAKVVARLTQLVKAEIVEKEQQKIGDAKLMCYRLK